MTVLDMSDFVIIIGLTTTLSIAGMTPIIYRFREHICDEIKDLASRLREIEKLD